MNLIDRLTTSIDKALDEGRTRMDLLRVRRRKDNAARDLGYLVYRESRGASPMEGEREALLKKISDAEVEIGELEARIREVRARGTQERAGPQPPGQSAEGPTA
jgi:hypothetical protein